MAGHDRNAELKRLRASWAAATEAMRVAQRAEEAAASARKASESQGRFMASLAHELKNPLNAIYGYAQMMRLLSTGGGAAAHQDKLATIENAARHLIGLTGDILTSEQIETGRLQVDPERFDIAALIEEVAELEQSAIQGNNNRLVIDATAEVGTLVSDRRRAAQILINLLSNAAKFTKGGEVRIGARRDEDGSVCLTVADTGVGIAPEKSAQLFHAFSDVGGKAARDAGGHGLGLYITAGLVRRLGGTISVDSAPGEGTRVHVWLPDLSHAPRPAVGSDSDVLTVGFTQALPSLDPLLQQLAVDAFVLDSIFECLTTVDRNGHITPQLACTWQQVDARTWKFHLDPSVRFQNGDPLTAADVIATLQRQHRLLDDPNCELQSIHPDLETYEAADDHTLVLRTRTPAPLFLEQLTAIPILHRSAGAIPLESFELSHAIGTGPYRLVDYGPHGFRLVAHPRPGRPDPRWKVVIGRLFATAQEAESAILSGRVDMIPNAGRELAQRLEQGAAVRVLRPNLNTIFFLQPNLRPQARGIAWWPDGRPIDANPLADIRVRRAVSLAVDREFLCQHALRGGARPLGSVVPPHFFGYDPSLQPEQYDPELAEHLLRLAGYPDGLTITVAATDDIESDDHQLLRALRAQLATAGINLRPSIVPLRDLPRPDRKPNFGLVVLNWVAYRPDAEMVLRDFGGTRDPACGFGACNYGGLSDPEIDQALQRAARCLDRAERSRLLQEASALIASDYLLIPLVQPDGCMAYRGHLDVTGHIQMSVRPDQIVVRDTEKVLLEQLLLA